MAKRSAAEGAKNRRRGKGEGDIHQRPDGRWEARLNLGWVNGSRRRKSIYGETREEVAKKLARAITDHQDGVPVLDERQTVAQFLERWLEHFVKVKCRPSTYRGYESKIRIHVLPDSIARLRLARLQQGQLESFFERKRAAGLHPQTVQHLRAILRAALQDAMERDLVARNVAKLTHGPRVPQREPLAVSPEAARAILAAVRGDRLEGLFVVALASGCRQGEILALVWKNVDLAASTLSVAATLQRHGGDFERLEPKTRRSRRTIALPPFGVEALRAHRIRQLEERVAAGPAWEDLGLVFTGPTGYPLHGPNVTLRFQALLRAAGLPRWTFHQLRHACGSLLVALGTHPRVVMEVLGHSNIQTTMNTYAHITPALQRDAADALGALITGHR